ncbi:aspartate 1-decarboxylase [Rhodocista pekingensis]|uniref:Aspartate 1-decarboxylase n=1 Tax=Rhodocista pekingensis TaxID=201185 RepID=A0ABW2KX51_9PROT
MIKVVRAKLHGITVTGADLNYHGSITLDPEICAQAGIYPMEFVEIWNRNSGARISTYVIFGEPGSGCCILNGAAARTCQRGDVIIIAASEYTTPDRLYTLKPRILTFTAGNRVDRVLRYDVFKGPDRAFDFRTLDITAGEDAAVLEPVPILD